MQLERSELFSALTPQELQQVRNIAKKIHFARGETIFVEGDYQKNIYIIESGQVEIYKKSPIHGEQSLAVMKNGDCFGEMAFFEKTATRSASARTLQASIVIVIEGADFERLLNTHPSISLKLLSTLSQRLKDTSRLVTHGTNKQVFQHDCRLITVASAKDGYGKSIFATSLAKMLAHETGKKVLFIDLDLYYAGGTQLIGVHSPRSIIDILNKYRANENKFDLAHEAIHVTKDLWAVPAPRNFLEAEQIHAPDISLLIKESRKHFDYIVADTCSMFDENFYTALDISDQIFFMVNHQNLSTLTDNVRFFQGISKLSYPRERLILIGNNISHDFTTSKTAKIFPYPVIAALPQIPDYDPQFGKTPYDISPSGPFCEVLRLLARNVLKEVNIKKPTAKGSIISMLFGEKDPEQAINTHLDELHLQHGEKPFAPIINANDVRAQVKYVRYNMLFGYLREAKLNLLNFLDHTQPSAPLCELLGEIFLLEDNKAEALDAFQKAVSLDENQHVAMGYLAYLTNDDTKLTKALASVQQKINNNPTHLDLRNDFGKILAKNGKYEEAQVQFQTALKENPNYLEAKINLASCLAHLGKTERSIETLLFIENKNPRIFFSLGEIFYQTGRLYLAYKAYVKAESLYPTYPGIRPKIAELSTYLRKLDSVIDLHERFVNTNPNFPDLHTKLGNFYHLAGKSELAMSEFQKALELNPDYRLAAEKLDAIKKDMIWRMAKTHLEEHIESEDAILAKQLKITFQMTNGSVNIKNLLPEETMLQVRNIRTGKLMQKVLSSQQLENGQLEIDCAPLGTLASQDILIFQLFDIKHKKVFRFPPHYLEKNEILTGLAEIEVDLHAAMQQPQSPEIFAKYFLVHLNSKHFAKIIGTENGSYQAIIRNNNNNLEARGHLNPENCEQINFVLKGSDVTASEDLVAVKSGDRLTIKINDGGNQEVFSMEFAVGESDVQSFCKTIIPKDIS